MSDPTERPPEPDAPLPPDPHAGTEAPGETSDPEVAKPDLDRLPLTGITRRRVAFVMAAVVTVWVIAVFARQVTEAADAASRADATAAQNAALADEVASLQHELSIVAERPYVTQQARGFGLGTEHEIPFQLAPDAPALPADAPGSAAQRLGETAAHRSPLDTWLTLLFGPTD